MTTGTHADPTLRSSIEPVAPRCRSYLRGPRREVVPRHRSITSPEAVAMSSSVNPTALRTARERAELTQHQLAHLVGVAGGERISRWELGLDEPRPETLARVARALDVPAMDLLLADAGRRDLRALRYSTGLSVRDVSVAAHVSTRTYSRWELGAWKRPPSDTDQCAIAGILGVRLIDVRDGLDLARATRTNTPNQAQSATGLRLIRPAGLTATASPAATEFDDEVIAPTALSAPRCTRPSGW